MKISRPKQYINILLDEIIQITTTAVNNLMHEQFHGTCCYIESNEKFNAHKIKVEELRKEILLVCQINCEEALDDQR